MPIQNNWWHCNKCHVLTFGGGLNPGDCQAGGQHNYGGSGEYSLVHDDPSAPGQQKWLWCNRCQELTFGGNPLVGVCPALPAGKPHDYTGSTNNFILATNVPGPPGQSNWRLCNKCQAMTWAGGTLGNCPGGGQHDIKGSIDYLIALQEPINQATNRYLLTTFGPCNTAAQARTTLQTACNTLIAKGGGVIVIPDSVPADFQATNAIQDAVNKTGVLIEDYRGGAMRLVVLPQGSSDFYNDLAGGITVERELTDDVQGQGGGSALAISNRSRGGVNSINDIVQQNVKQGLNARFYVNSLRGLCPGNWVNISDGVHMTSGPIKGLGLDGDNPYFLADSQYDYQALKTRYWNKNWFSAMEIADTHNADDQSGSVTIARTTYGTGDTFVISTALQYSGDIMSAGGDEGGVVYSAEVRHDVDLFWGEVESWDPATQTLVYKDLSAPLQKPENWWKLGTSRPIINMNSAKWNQSGKIIIPQNGYDYAGIPSSVVGNASVKWDPSIIGMFITIDEPSEYWDPNSSDPDPLYVDKTWANFLGHHIVRRWFRIGSLEQRKDGLWNLGIETVWWGNYQGGKPPLLNVKNYYTTVPNELSYIIAPGSWAMDVRNALGPRKYYIGATSQERTLRLAPVQNAASVFAPGDIIAQPAGPTPWGPTSYRTRQFNFFPPLMPGHGYIAANLGPTTMGAGFIVDGARGQLADIQQHQKDGMPSFATGLTVTASTSYGIFINGPVLYAAMFLDQQDGNKKLIQWLGPGTGASIYSEPATGDFTIQPSGNINLSLKSTFNQGGISATGIAAQNLRGFDVPVTGNVTSFPVAFAKAEPDANYAILVQCNWTTATAVQSKTPGGFTVLFDKTSPPAGAKLDWFLIR